MIKNSKEGLMRRNLLSVSLAVVALLLATVTVFAHHSVSAEFDNTKPVDIKGGVVKVVEWTNPHIYTQVEYKGPDGKVSLYRIEGGAPNALFRNGWRKDSLKPGTIVNFSGHRAKNPQSINCNGKMTLPDGKIAWAEKNPEYNP
jgi:hypothetical protein